jgi:uncharacterized protein YndB with AHSA1/START domain
MHLTDDERARTIISTRLVPAAPDDVFDAYANPEKLVRWWGPAGFTMTNEELDLRPGGEWRFVFHGPDGRDYKNHLRFAEIERPTRFVVDHLNGPLYHGIVTFAPEAGGTRVTMYWTFEHPDFVKKQGHVVAEGNEGNFDRMTEVVLGTR